MNDRMLYVCKCSTLLHFVTASSLLSNEIQHNLNKWCVTNIKDAGNNLVALFDRGKKILKFKWRCYSPEALVPEQTAYDTAKKSSSYYTREELAKIYLTGIPLVSRVTDSLRKEIIVNFEVTDEIFLFPNKALLDRKFAQSCKVTETSAKNLMPKF